VYGQHRFITPLCPLLTHELKPIDACCTKVSVVFHCEEGANSCAPRRHTTMSNEVNYIKLC